MTGTASLRKTKPPLLYYRCQTPIKGRFRIKDCSAPYFRADKVDAAIWAWIEEVFTDDKKLENGIRGYQAEVEEKAAPTQEQLRLIEDLITQQEQAWTETMANMKAAKSPRAKDIFAGELAAIESTLDNLAIQRTKVQAELETNTLTDEQIISIREFAAQMREDIEQFRQDFESRRLLIERLNVEVTLEVVDGVHIAHVIGKIGKKSIDVEIYSIITNGASITG